MIQGSKEFEQGLSRAIEAQFAQIPQKETEIDIPLSDSFQETCQALIRQTQEQPRARRRAGLKRALLAAAVVAVLVTSAWAIPVVREAVASIFVNESDPVQYTLSLNWEQHENAPDSIETAYFPAYVPEGYEALSRSVSAASVIGIWADGEGRQISFFQFPIPDPANVDGWLGIDAEHTRWERLTLGPVNAVLFSGAENRLLVWIENGYFFTLNVPAALSQEETIRIFYHISQA